MVTANPEKYMNIYDDDIEANRTKSIKEDEDTEPLVNNSSHHEDDLQDHLVITGIPLIAIVDSKDNEVGQYEENEGSAVDSPLVSVIVFFRHFVCGIMLGFFFVWPAIRICFFYLLTRCKPIGNLLFVDYKEQDLEMSNLLLIKALYFGSDRSSAAWRIIFSIDTFLVNDMMLFFIVAMYLSKEGCHHKGTLHGVIYSPMVTSLVHFLSLIVTLIVTRSGHLNLLEVPLIASPLVLMVYVIGAAVEATNGAIDGLRVNLIAYAIWNAVSIFRCMS